MTQGTAQMDTWLTRQQKAFEALAGTTVSAWDGVEMALRDDSPEGPQFTDPEVEFLQLTWLRLITDARQHTIGIYQDDDCFGLKLEATGRPAPEDCYGIFRWRKFDLPVGYVGAVKVVFDEGTLARITLTIDGRDLLFVAGEVYETWAGTLEVHQLDESVLVFTDPADAETVHWM